MSEQWRCSWLEFGELDQASDFDSEAVAEAYKEALGRRGIRALVYPVNIEEAS